MRIGSTSEGDATLLAHASTTPSSTSYPSQITQLAFTLPTSPDTKIYTHINSMNHALLVVLATTSIISTASTPPLGNLVYAIPNRLEPAGQSLCTTLYARASSLDFVSRLARVLSKKLGKPVYVGGEVKLWVQEDEALALRGILDIVMKAVEGVAR